MPIYNSCLDLGTKNARLSSFSIEDLKEQRSSGRCELVMFDNNKDQTTYFLVHFFISSNNVCYYKEMFDILDHVNYLVRFCYTIEL